MVKYEIAKQERREIFKYNFIFTYLSKLSRENDREWFSNELTRSNSAVEGTPTMAS